ncbi:MAG: bifunctional folylpolyglutamate synthase/dihydrofolate synthase [Acidobacteria bacterium]|nr:MAG: bifunctional folylpolyglutamate synthase/dihydrofolate synthase [Acidobacteriota bacterium]
MSYETAVERLYALGHELQHGTPRKFDLAHMRVLCDALGNPQRSFPSVLIAGTNGKGSTAATLASILHASGHRVGLYTSPHLLRVNERICLNGQPIADDDFADAYDRISAVAARLVAMRALPHPASFFETMTAMAFDFFAASKIEIAVLEVGMGGRLDATNVVEPVLSVITDIDLDHQKFLGDTIAEIARQKAGILRPNVAAVTLPQHPEANRVLGERMIEIGARSVSAARNVPSVSPQSSTLVHSTSVETRFRLSVLGREVEIVSPLVGRHQLRNLALAITAAEELAAQGFRITPESIALGTRQTSWPGRFQRLEATAQRPEIILDVAHNPAGAWALRSALSEQVGERPLVLLFGAMADKAVVQIAQILWPLMNHVIVTRVAHNPRAATTSSLAALAQSLGVEHTESATVREGLDLAIAQALKLGSEALVVIAGSIYLAGEVMEGLR